MRKRQGALYALIAIASIAVLPVGAQTKDTEWPTYGADLANTRYRPLDAALHRLMMQSQRAGHRKKRRVFRIGQQYPRALDPARGLGSRLRDHLQPRPILNLKPQFNRPPPRRHDLPRAP